MINSSDIKKRSRSILDGRWLKESILFYTVIFPTIFSRFSFGPAITSIVTLLTIPLFFGYIRRLMYLRGGDEGSFEDLLYYYKNGQAVDLIALSVLNTLLVFFWGFLIVIPGIIASITYSFSFFLKVANPSIGPRGILEMSRSMTKGYRLDIFLLMLSFIGWGILVSLVAKLSFNLATLISLPLTVYMMISQLELFQGVRRQDEQ